MKRSLASFLVLGFLGLSLCLGMITMNRKAMKRRAWLTASETDPQAAHPLVDARQMLVVATADWQAVNGTLQRYERATATGKWQAVGAAIPIVVGRSGLAWGRGLHGEPDALAKPEDPRKREGDGKSPAGAFRLSAAFGYAPRAEAKRIKLPYTQSRELTQCVDDVQSTRYNQLVQRDSIAQPDWQSHEDMRRQDELYRWGIFVDHNSGAQRQPAGGSCIFLHIWAGANVGTAGCTAMEAVLMEQVLFWLDPAKQPRLVQLPQRAYERLKDGWQLPARK